MPDKGFEPVKRWEHDGFDCLVTRRADGEFSDGGKYPGWYCGYVRLPDDARLPHEWRFAPSEIADAFDYEINFSGTPISADGGNWYGFDMGHAGDYGPATSGWPCGTYIRTLDDAVWQTERLADEIAIYLECVSGAHRTCRYCGSDLVCVNSYYLDTPKDGYAATCHECGARGPIAETIAEAWTLWENSR